MPANNRWDLIRGFKGLNIHNTSSSKCQLTHQTKRIARGEFRFILSSSLTSNLQERHHTGYMFRLFTIVAPHGESVHWFHLALERVQWPDLVNTFKNTWVPKSRANFNLTTRYSISFTRSTLQHSASRTKDHNRNKEYRVENISSIKEQQCVCGATKDFISNGEVWYCLG